MGESKKTLQPSIEVVNTSPKPGPEANADANHNGGVQGAFKIEQPGVDAGLQPDASETEKYNNATKSDDNNKGQIETASKTPQIDTPINGTPSTEWKEAFRNLGYMLGRLKTYLKRSDSTLGKWVNADFNSLFSENVPKDSPKGAATMPDRSQKYVIQDPAQLKVVTPKFDSIAGEFSDLSQGAAGTASTDTPASPTVVPPASPTFAPTFKSKSNIIPPFSNPNNAPAPIIKPSNSHHHTSP